MWIDKGKNIAPYFMWIDKRQNIVSFLFYVSGFTSNRDETMFCLLIWIDKTKNAFSINRQQARHSREFKWRQRARHSPSCLCESTKGKTHFFLFSNRQRKNTGFSFYKSTKGQTLPTIFYEMTTTKGNYKSTKKKNTSFSFLSSTIHIKYSGIVLPFVFCHFIL